VKVEAGGVLQHTAEGHGSKEPAFHDLLEFVIGGEVTQRDGEMITLEVSFSTSGMLFPLSPVLKERQIPFSFDLTARTRCNYKFSDLVPLNLRVLIEI